LGSLTTPTNLGGRRIMKCKKCKIKMIKKREWADDGFGHCGDVVYYECPKCDKTILTNEGEEYSYGYVHD